MNYVFSNCIIIADLIMRYAVSNKILYKFYDISYSKNFMFIKSTKNFHKCNNLLVF